MNKHARILSYGLGFLLILSPVFADDMLPPSQVLAVDLGASGAKDLIASGYVVDHQADSNASFSYIGRHRLNSGPFYISGGVRGEVFNLRNDRDFPIRHLQDYGGQMSIEYYVGAVRAAYLTFRPGFYFETHPTLASWDVPVEFATGIPITQSLNGVVGISNARFLHHPVPIAGLSWTINPKLRLDAIYPNPTLAYTVNQQLEVQLAGELLGGGFLTDPEPERKVVQYYVYRVGPNLLWKLRPGFKVIGGAGLEYQRDINFWRNGQSYLATGAPYVRLGLEFSR